MVIEINFLWFSQINLYIYIYKDVLEIDYLGFIFSVIVI